MNRQFETTCFAIRWESSLAEETIETVQSPEIVRISPVGTPPLPMFQTATVSTDVKFLNGIRRKSAERFSTPSLGFDRLTFDQECSATELNEINTRKRPDLKTSRTSAWSKRIPLRVVSWGQQTLFGRTSSSEQSRSLPADRAGLVRSQARPLPDRYERAVVFDPGRAQQTLPAGVSRNASS